MIRRIYRLIDTKRIEMKQREIKISRDLVLVKPDFMSVCAADQRYYLGQRNPEALLQKLPMALIHEATGTVLHDYGGRMSSGEKVVLMPLEVSETQSEIKGNYRSDSKFASSGTDGFMCDLIALPFNRMIPVTGNYSVAYVFSEILSVAFGAIEAFEKSRVTSVGKLGIWGDGSMGYVMGLALRVKYPNSKISVFGKNRRKLQKFSFADEVHYVYSLPNNLSVSHAFECVGGKGSGDAIEQITKLILPQGTISLMGVSEETVQINTRRVLEKGLRLVGNSRSDSNNFYEAVSAIGENAKLRKYLQILISDTIEIRNEDDIPGAFDQDALNDFKTVLKWLL